MKAKPKRGLRRRKSRKWLFPSLGAAAAALILVFRTSVGAIVEEVTTRLFFSAPVEAAVATSPRDGGSISLSGSVKAGDGNFGDGGDVRVRAGDGTNGGAGGEIMIGPGTYSSGSGGSSGGDGGGFVIQAGNGGTNGGNGGSVFIRAGDGR